jgi:hypothetical protein
VDSVSQNLRIFVRMLVGRGACNLTLALLLSLLAEVKVSLCEQQILCVWRDTDLMSGENRKYYKNMFDFMAC